MPQGKRGEVDEGARPEVEGDRISALPDVLLSHVLSLLPAEEAVRTCVLARRWRHLWKSAPALRIGYLHKHKPKSVGALRKFVDHLLLLRGGLSLNKFELRLGGFSGPDDVPRVNLWLRQAVMCKIRVLKLYLHHNNAYIDPWLELDDLPLVSKYLTRLQLRGVRCHASFLNFSSCPALEQIEFEYCNVSSAQKISSEYLKCLSITDSVFGEDSRIRICAPNLVSLHLDDPWFYTPILESMPGLAKAFVRIAEQCHDSCSKLWDPHQHCDCQYCNSSDNIGDGADNCMLLKGLSEAKSLVLISDLDLVYLLPTSLCDNFDYKSAFISTALFTLFPLYYLHSCWILIDICL